MAGTLFPGVALVTGAAGTGIGAAVAKSFAAAGCTKIAVTDINHDLLMDTVAAIRHTHPNVEVLATAGDISQEKFVDDFVGQVAETFGRVDYCVNCAGILGSNRSSADMSTEAFDQVNNVNYRGCWFSSRAQIRVMLKQEVLLSHDAGRRGQRGAIVNIASQLGLVGRPSAPVYSASKAAVIAMTRADAIDYSDKDIRVNCICPGLIATPMTTCDEERLRLMRPAIDIAPMKRMGTVNEVADCALFLASTQASFVQGHAMVVDVFHGRIETFAKIEHGEDVKGRESEALVKGVSNLPR